MQKLNIPEEFKNEIRSDIARIDREIEYKTEKNILIKLHKEIDSKYQSCILNWYQGLNEASYLQNGNLYLEYAYLDKYDNIVENLTMWKNKLKIFLYGMNSVANAESSTTSVNVTTNVNVSVTFEQAYSQIENMTSLTEEETADIKEKIDMLKEIINSKDKKKTKWEKAKVILAWLANKSFDVGMVLLPLLLKIQE